MTDDEKYISEAKARKQLVGLLALGIVMTIAGLAAPMLFARFHLGHEALAKWLRWRLPVGGTTVSCAAAYALYKFRPGYDRT